MSPETRSSGFCREDMVELEVAHGDGNVREGDGKGAAEAAALLGLAEGEDFQARRSIASSVRVASPLPVPREWQERWNATRASRRPGQAVDAEAVDDEVGQFPGAAGERFAPAGGSDSFSNSSGAPWKTHRGAGTGGHDHGRCRRRRRLDRVAHDFARGGPVAAVEGGLAAAGLVLGKFDFAAEVFEHLDGGDGDSS